MRAMGRKRPGALALGGVRGLDRALDRAWDRARDGGAPCQETLTNTASFETFFDISNVEHPATNVGLFFVHQDVDATGEKLPNEGALVDQNAV